MLDIVGGNEGAQGPSSDQRVSAMQLFWLHSCRWPPGNAATTGSSSKAEVSRLSKNLQVRSCHSWGCGCPLGDSWE